MALHRSYTLTPDEEACNSAQIWLTLKNTMTGNNFCKSSLRSNLNSNILAFPNKYIQNTNYIKGGLKMRKKKYLKNIGVLLTDKQYERLVKITDKREITMSKFIREIVQDKIGPKNNGQK